SAPPGVVDDHRQRRQPDGPAVNNGPLLERAGGRSSHDQAFATSRLRTNSEPTAPITPSAPATMNAARTPLASAPAPVPTVASVATATNSVVPSAHMTC